MSDKLPTIYLTHVDTERIVKHTAAPLVVSVVSRSSSVPYHTIAYEPAVPRCRTCPHHHKHCEEPAFCCRWDKWLRNNDGSGYCSEHVEARR